MKYTKEQLQAFKKHNQIRVKKGLKPIKEDGFDWQWCTIELLKKRLVRSRLFY